MQFHVIFSKVEKFIDTKLAEVGISASQNKQFLINTVNDPENKVSKYQSIPIKINVTSKLPNIGNQVLEVP